MKAWMGCNDKQSLREVCQKLFDVVICSFVQLIWAANAYTLEQKWNIHDWGRLRNNCKFKQVKPNNSKIVALCCWLLPAWSLLNLSSLMVLLSTELFELLFTAVLTSTCKKCCRGKIKWKSGKLWWMNWECIQVFACYLNATQCSVISIWAWVWH